MTVIGSMNHITTDPPYLLVAYPVVAQAIPPSPHFRRLLKIPYIGLCLKQFWGEQCCYIFNNIKLENTVALLLSPARRGRGILVAPGFCPGSGVRRHVFLWAQKLENYWSIVFEILTSHS